MISQSHPSLHLPAKHTTSRTTPDRSARWRRLGALLALTTLIAVGCGGDDAADTATGGGDMAPATATGAELCEAFDVQAAAAVFDDPATPTEGWGGRPETDVLANTCWVAVGYDVTTVAEIQFRQENLGGAPGFDAVVDEIGRGPEVTSTTGVGEQTATYTGGVIFQSGDGVYVVQGPPSIETDLYLEAATIFAAGL